MRLVEKLQCLASKSMCHKFKLNSLPSKAVLVPLLLPHQKHPKCHMHASHTILRKFKDKCTLCYSTIVYCFGLFLKFVL